MTTDKKSRAWARWIAAGLAGGISLVCAGPCRADESSGPPPRVAGFEEPLVSFGASSALEDRELAQAIALHDAGSYAGMQPLARFVDAHPDSAWRVALQTDLGLWYYREGFFVEAIDAWEDAWRTVKAVPAADARARALADRAVGELIRMHARLGHSARLAELLDEVASRPLTGPATEMVAGAKQGLWTMRNDPGVAYLCGPGALRALALRDQAARPDDLSRLEAYRSGPQGVSLTEVAQLARDAHLGLKPAFRLPGTAIPVPSVVHWKVGHYAAIVGLEQGSYHLQDPTFGTDLWVSAEAVERESSGYFMIPQAVAAGWRVVSAAEGRTVRGMGYTSASDPNATRDADQKTKPDCKHAGLCGYNSHDTAVSLDVVDVPVGYTPAYGPDMHVRLNYSQREARQPAVPTFFNFGPKWTSPWLSYVVDVPGRPGVSVMTYARGGGAYDEHGYSAVTGRFTPEAPDFSVLVLVSTAPITYARLYKDGSRDVYAASDGATAYPRRVFLTQVVDPAGNAATLSYDASLRLAAITDPQGRQVVFTYGSSSFPLQPTTITDPFGRTAQITYDAAGRLASITDAAGLQSVLTYDAGTFLTSLVSPYGTTTFSYGESGPDRFLTMTDPLGYTERLESKQQAPAIPFSDSRGVPAGMDPGINQYLYYRNTFYWDKSDYALHAGDYTQARIKHFYHDYFTFGYSSAALASLQDPLEGRVWITTPNDNGLQSGTYNLPRQVGRVLDDGSSQLTTLFYNGTGNVTRIIDAQGRTTQLQYAANGTDVAAILVHGRTGTATTVASYTYNTQHLPLTYTDAARNVTKYAYNAVGQVTSETDALNEVMSYQYDTLGELTRIGDRSGKTRLTLTYDAAGRVATSTDSEGRVVTYAYDNLDRVTAVGFPDGSSEHFTWANLDIVDFKDRLDRHTTYAYDADRNLVSVTDALNRKTRLAYYPDGSLLSLTDGRGNVTTWLRDAQSRQTGKRYADGSTDSIAWETYGGRVHGRTDAAGRTTTFAWGNDDRLAGIAYAGGTVAAAPVSIAYDPVYGLPTSMTDGSGTTSYAYGAPGKAGALEIVSEAGPFANSSIAYAYDALGRLSQRTVGTSVETFTYDIDGRLATEQNDLGTTRYTYLGETAQVATASLGSLAGSSFGYDSNTNDRRLVSIASAGARGFQFASNAQYQFTSISDTALPSVRRPVPTTGRTWSLSYDTVDQLLAANLSTGSTYAYAYDQAGNITSWQSPGGSTGDTYGVTNQMQTLGSLAVVQDAAGETIDDGLRTYQWDAAGRLAGIGYKNNASLQSVFRYDGQGRRIADVETVNGVSVQTRYLWCGNRLCQVRDGSDNVIRRYFSQGETRPATGDRFFYDRDQLDSVRDITAVATGAVVGSLDYDPYGNLLASQGSITSSDFRYAGMLYHATSGLYLTQYRLYDPRAGRWLSRDPLFESAGINLYGYGAGSPLSYADPDGRMPLLVLLPLIGGVIGGVSDVLAAGPCQSLLGAFGRGFVSGAAGTFAALWVGAATGNPALAGAAAGGTSNLLDQVIEKGSVTKIDPVALGAATVTGSVGGYAGARLLKLAGRPPSLAAARNLSNYGLNSQRLVGQELGGDVVGGLSGYGVTKLRSGEPPCACP